MPVEIIRTDLGQEKYTCPAHGSFTSTGQQIRIGRINNEMWTKCPGCTQALAAAELVAAQRAVTQKKLDHIAGVLDQSAIPKRFIGRTFENFTAETPAQMTALRTARRYAVQFDSVLKTGRTMIFKGNPGTGKSHLACAILQHIMPEHVGVYTTTMDLVRKLREGWGGKAGSESDVLAEVGSLPLLVLDEVGVQFGSEGERIHLHDVLDRRYREMLPTILITNAEDPDFQKFVGDRVYDRLNEIGHWVNFLWKSHRVATHKEMV